MAEFIQKKDTDQIIGVCIKVYNTLGYGFSEIVYKDAMELEFLENGNEYSREQEYAVQYRVKYCSINFLLITHCLSL